MMKKQNLILTLTLALLSIVLPNRSLHAQGTIGCETTVVVQAGDSLSAIAGQQLGNLAAYNNIVDATNAKAATDASYPTINNPNVLNVGWKLCIPAAGTSGVSAPARPSSNAETATTESDTVQAPATQAPAAQAPVVQTPSAQPSTTLDAEDRRLDITKIPQLKIETMRKASFPGSDIVIEETLAAGVNYSRYVVSYLSDGNKILAMLTVPNGTQPETGWPAIVFNHGYIPPEIYRTTQRYVNYVDGFARNGYIVLKSDYRGHGFSEGEPSSTYNSPNYTNDVLNALASIKKYPAADPNRIGMWGHSMGGSITLRSMVVNGDIKAGVIWAGVVASYADLFEFWIGRPGPWQERGRRWREKAFAEYGSVAESPEFWADISANSYLTDLSGPIQLHHGTADKDVPVAFSRSLEDEINAVGGAVEYYEYAGDNHNISNSFGSAMARSIAFFDRYVKGITEN